MIKNCQILLCCLVVFGISQGLVEAQNGKSGINAILNEGAKPTQTGRENKVSGQPNKTIPSAKNNFKQRAVELKKRIGELKQRGYGDLELIRSPKEAAGKIAELKKRRDQLGAKFEGETARLTKETVKASDKFETKWSSITKTFLEDKKRSAKEWVEWEKNSLKSDNDAIGNTEQDKRGDGNTSFKAIRETIDQSEKPSGMPPEIWARTQDRFFRELAELQIKVASTQKALDDKKKKELSAIDQAIVDAEKNFRQLVDAGGRPGDSQLRNLAWQLHRARLQQMIALYNRLQAASRGSERGQLDQQEQIRIKPLDPHTTVNDIARKIQTSNRPGAPERGRFDDYDGEGLPDLFPSDRDTKSIKDLMNKDLLYGNIVKNRLDRNRRLLEGLNKEVVELKTGSEADVDRKNKIEKDIQWLVDRIAKDSAVLEQMGPATNSKKSTKQSEKKD